MGAENITNLSDFQIGLKDLLPTEILVQVDKLVLISKVAIYILVGYIIFLIVKQFFGWRRNKRINLMYYKINELDRKLDLLLGKKKIKPEVIKKKKRLLNLFRRKKKEKKEK